jgi:hypothetical protein
MLCCCKCQIIFLCIWSSQHVFDMLYNPCLLKCGSICEILIPISLLWYNISHLFVSSNLQGRQNFNVKGEANYQMKQDDALRNRYTLFHVLMHELKERYFFLFVYFFKDWL